MPLPQPGQKGSKKRDGRHNHNSHTPSRNTTPSSVSIPPLPAPASSSIESGETTLLDTRLKPYTAFKVDELIDNKDHSNIPDLKSLDVLLDRLNTLSQLVEAKGHIVDKGMRKLAKLRKEKIEDAESERITSERKEAQIANRKKKQQLQDAKSERDSITNVKEEPPIPSSIASLAALPNASVNRKRAASHASGSSGLSSPNPTSPSTLTAAKNEAVEEEEDVEPAPMRGDIRFFGNDPSTYIDDVRYQVPPITPDMTKEEGLEIASVASMPWPVGRDTLLRYAPVEPPHDDFSGGKPSSQVQASTWQTWVEPYLRPLIEEDMALLRDRGNRTAPFHIPPRNPKHYLQQWAEEDGEMDIDDIDPRNNAMSTVESRGDILDLDENGGETDKVSLAPVQSRFFQLLRTGDRTAAADAASNNLLGNDSMLLDNIDVNMPLNDDLATGMNGDMSLDQVGDRCMLTVPTPTDHDQNFMFNKDMDLSMNGTANGVNGTMSFNMLDTGSQTLDGLNGNLFDSSIMGGATFKPATAITQPAADSSAKKHEPAVLTRQEQDARLLAEFLHTLGPTEALSASTIGPASTVKPPSFDAHMDDDIAVRLRHLQSELKEVTIKNAARKARIMDEAQAFYSKQEYDIVHDDLDAQVNDIHSKRTRTLKTGKNKKRSSATGTNGAGQAKFALGDRAKSILANRKKWETMIGPALVKEGNYSVPRTGVAKEGEREGEATSIFGEKEMESYLANERALVEAGVDDVVIE